jgi:hypothetical protein
MNSYTFSPTTITNNSFQRKIAVYVYNPMYKLVYDQQVMPHPTKPLDLHPLSQAQ